MIPPSSSSRRCSWSAPASRPPGSRHGRPVGRMKSFLRGNAASASRTVAAGHAQRLLGDAAWPSPASSPPPGGSSPRHGPSTLMSTMARRASAGVRKSPWFRARRRGGPNVLGSGGPSGRSRRDWRRSEDGARRLDAAQGRRPPGRPGRRRRLLRKLAGHGSPGRRPRAPHLPLSPPEPPRGEAHEHGYAEQEQDEQPLGLHGALLASAARPAAAPPPAAMASRIAVSACTFFMR